jgi:hypothetical protein
MNSPKLRLVLIDDDAGQLADLEQSIRAEPEAADFELVSWKPDRDTADVAATFAKLVEPGATLVVTDYDLTRYGPTGFFGVSIVAWCQQRAIPVSDFSRGTPAALPTDSNLFEFRIPTTAREAAPFIVAIASGFHAIRREIEGNQDLLSSPSPANMLADLLGRPEAVSSFALYDVQIGANTGLVQLLREDKSIERRQAVAIYILGDLLFNSILRFPGPILDRRALCAYFACADAAAPHILDQFQSAVYSGPFQSLGPFFWHSDVDDLVETWASVSELTYTGNSASYRRSLLEEVLGGQPLDRFVCPRCAGEQGYVPSLRPWCASATTVRSVRPAGFHRAPTWQGSSRTSTTKRRRCSASDVAVVPTVEKTFATLWNKFQAELPKLGGEMRPKQATDVFTYEEGPTGASVTAKPICLKLRERGDTRDLDLFVAIEGLITFTPNSHRTDLRTSGFKTRVGYFRVLEPKRLEHVFGIHYDHDYLTAAHPVFHSQIAPMRKFVDTVNGHFNREFAPIDPKDDRVAGLLATVRVPTVHMDLFSTLLQIVGDHTIHKSSGANVKGSFKALTKAVGTFRSGMESATRLQAVLEQQCFRAGHWYP